MNPNHLQILKKLETTVCTYSYKTSCSVPISGNEKVRISLHWPLNLPNDHICHHAHSPQRPNSHAAPFSYHFQFRHLNSYCRDSAGLHVSYPFSHGVQHFIVVVELRCLNVVIVVDKFLTIYFFWFIQVRGNNSHHQVLEGNWPHLNLGLIFFLVYCYSQHLCLIFVVVEVIAILFGSLERLSCLIYYSMSNCAWFAVIKRLFQS